MEPRNPVPERTPPKRYASTFGVIVIVVYKGARRVGVDDWSSLFQHINAIKKASPGYSFGIRHSEYTAPLIAEALD